MLTFVDYYKTGTQDSVYKPLSDIDFKELPAELATYFTPFNISNADFYIVKNI